MTTDHTTNDYGASFSKDLATMRAKIRRSGCKFRLTHLDVSAAVERIAAVENDDELKHSMEDNLFTLVLIAIANNRCADPASCAAATLKSLQIDFMRHKA